MLPFARPLVSSRFALLLASTCVLGACVQARAATPADVLSPEEQAITQLELRAEKAGLKDQCFLYTELVHSMAELAGHQLITGDTDRANATLKQVAHYADLIHLGLSKDTHRLKNAEMLMQQTNWRLTGFLHATSGEDRQNLQTALKQLNHVQDELMTAVFHH